MVRHGARRDGGNVLEELRLGDTGVAHEADVDVAADLHAVGHLLGDAAHEQQQQRLLDVLVAEDLGAMLCAILVYLVGSGLG